MLPASEIWEGASQPPLIIGFHVPESREETCTYIRKFVWGIINLAMTDVYDDQAQVFDNEELTHAPRLRDLRRSFWTNPNHWIPCPKGARGYLYLNSKICMRHHWVSNDGCVMIRHEFLILRNLYMLPATDILGVTAEPPLIILDDVRSNENWILFYFIWKLHGTLE